jgi:hypothetical protein
MDASGKASHLVGWVGLRPRNDESAGKIQSRKTMKARMRQEKSQRKVF